MLMEKIKNLVKAIPEYQEYRYKYEKLDNHKFLEEKKITKKRASIYYIIRFSDEQSCGWTVWERVALYGCIYAEERGYIPVIDMQTKKNIYLEESEVGKVNAWDKFYLQPAGISYNQAIESNNYILGDPSQEWFVYLRLRKARKINTEYLRRKYKQYIVHRDDIEKELEKRYMEVIKKQGINENSKLLGICIRGTDYVNFQHAVQPFDLIMEEARALREKRDIDAFFVATEDKSVYQKIQEYLSGEIVLSYKAGGIESNVNGLIGEVIRSNQTADDAALDYLTVLYIMDKCTYLVGGYCGATIVAEYKKNPPYDYYKIININEHY